MVGVVCRRTPHRHDRVADKLVYIPTNQVPLDFHILEITSRWKPVVCADIKLLRSKRVENPLGAVI